MIEERSEESQDRCIITSSKTQIEENITTMQG